jgi:hypothetical protein
MKKIIIAPCYLTKEKINEELRRLFSDKTNIPIKVTGFPQVNEICNPEIYHGGIYWGLNRVSMKNYFCILFNANELFPDYKLNSEYNSIIKITRKIGYFPDYDTPNGFSEIEVKRYKELTANELEVDEYFTFSLLSRKTNIIVSKNSITKDPANFTFQNISTLKENWITFETALGDNLRKLNKAFQLLCEFYFEENRKKSMLRK